MNLSVDKLLTRLSNHVDANTEVLAAYIAEHPDLGPDEREAFARSLQTNARKLMDLVQRFNGR